jgi:hypothetical protein
MEPERARELLAAERARIEQALRGLGREDDAEPADEFSRYGRTHATKRKAQMRRD